MRLYDYAASGNCYKVRLLLALLEQPYERVAIDIFAGETLTDDYLAINAARETPVLELDDGTLLTQSNAILWYLAEGTALLPVGRLAHSRVVNWLMFEQEYVISGIAGPRFWVMTGRGDASMIASQQERGREALARLNAHLTQREFLCDSFSIADIAVFAYLHVAPEAGLALDEHPAVTAWVSRVECQPRFVNDMLPYPANATPDMSRSIYD
jgi:glutathione S-transferase